MLEKAFLLLSVVAGHVQICPLHTSFLWDVQYRCNAHASDLPQRASNIGATIAEIQGLMSNGGCPQLTTLATLRHNPDSSDYRMPSSMPPWITRSPDPGMASGQGFTIGSSELHVMFYIDTEWSPGPAELDWGWIAYKILTEVQNTAFPTGTTFEVIVAAPDNVYAHYPVHRDTVASGRRRRDSPNPMHDCIIEEMNVLFQRLKSSLRVGPIPTQVAKVAGLTSNGITSLSSYYMKYVMTAARSKILVVNLINHENFITGITAASKERFLNEVSVVSGQKSIFQLFLFRNQDWVDRFVELMGPLDRSYAISVSGGYWRYNIQIFINWWFFPATTTTIAPTIDVSVITDKCSCINGCTCEPSCKDENNYYCRPKVGFPFIGKNCEYQVTPTCSADAVSVTIPFEAILWYAQGVANVAIHGCASGICHPTDAICGPTQTVVGNTITLNCPVAPMLFNGSIRSSVVFVMDRIDDLISMPRALTRVDCIVEVREASAVIRPEIRGVNTLERVTVWQPTISFWKTSFDIRPGIPANNLAIPGTGTIVYVVGEMLHVRLETDFDGAPAAVLSSSHTIALDTCVLHSTTEPNKAITIINKGVVPHDLPFPIVIDRLSGVVGGGVPMPGVGFQFQMFQFMPGSEITLECSVTMDGSGRRRRRSENDVNNISVKFLVVEPGHPLLEELLDDIQTIIVNGNVNGNTTTASITATTIPTTGSTVNLALALGELFNLGGDSANATTNTTSPTRSTVNLAQALGEFFDFGKDSSITTTTSTKSTVNLAEAVGEFFHLGEDSSITTTTSTKTTVNLAEAVGEFLHLGEDNNGRNTARDEFVEIEEVIEEVAGSIVLMIMIVIATILFVLAVRQRREMLNRKSFDHQQLIEEDKTFSKY